MKKDDLSLDSLPVASIVNLKGIDIESAGNCSLGLAPSFPGQRIDPLISLVHSVKNKLAGQGENG